MGYKSIVSANEIELSNYAKFHLRHIGFQWQNKVTNEILSKSQYFDRYRDTYQDEWKMIPYEPEGGWSSQEERESHFKEVENIFKDFQDEILKFKLYE